MSSALHPDPDVQTRLSAWGVTEGSAEALTARELFTTIADMTRYLSTGYLKVGSHAGREFFAAFLSGTGDGKVDQGRDAYLSGIGGLVLARELGVKRSELGLFAWLVNQWNTAASKGEYFSLANDYTISQSWEILFRGLGITNVRKLAARHDLFSEHVIYGVRHLLEAGLSPREIVTYSLLYRDTSMYKGRNFYVSEARRMHDAGVPADYAMAFTTVGTQNPETASIIALWQGGVPVEYATGGFSVGHSPDAVLRMHRDSVPLEYMMSLGGRA